MGVTGNEEENGKLEIRVGEVGWHLWCATAPSNRTQKAAWTPSDWRPFKNRQQHSSRELPAVVKGDRIVGRTTWNSW